MTNHDPVVLAAVFGLSGAEFVAIVVATLSLTGVLVGNAVSARANRSTARNQASLSNLEWVKRANANADAAETKSIEAETRADRAEQRAERAERRLEANEERLRQAETSSVELVDWIVEIVDLAHDRTDVDHARLVSRINGGPAGLRRVRRTPGS